MWRVLEDLPSGERELLVSGREWEVEPKYLGVTTRAFCTSHDCVVLVNEGPLGDVYHASMRTPGGCWLFSGRGPMPTSSIADLEAVLRGICVEALSDEYDFED